MYKPWMISAIWFRGPTLPDPYGDDLLTMVMNHVYSNSNWDDPPSNFSKESDGVAKSTRYHQTFRWYLKWRNPHLYKLYGYGLCKGVSPPPK